MNEYYEQQMSAQSRQTTRSSNQSANKSNQAKGVYSGCQDGYYVGGNSAGRQQNQKPNNYSKSTEESNQTWYEDKQIIRKDSKNCFVESLWDTFSRGKAHLCFASYDLNLDPGSRQTDKVNIYISIQEIFRLCMNISNGIMLSQLQDPKVSTIYETMGGTSARLLQKYGNPRPDGRSLSRVLKIAKGRNGFLMIADSGPGEEDEKGLIVPKFGNKPENHVVVSISWDGLCELLLMTLHAYQTWAIVNQKYKEKEK